MAFKRSYKSKYRKWKKRARGKFGRPAGRRTFQSRVRKAILKTAETKYYDISTENRQLYHNLGGNGVNIPLAPTSLTPWFNPWLNIQKGTGRFNRIGDRITPRGMSLKIYLANKLDRPHCQIRLIVAILPKSIGTTITTEQFDPFQISNAGINGNNMLWPADKDNGVKFLYDKIHKIDGMNWFSTPTNGKEVTKYVRLWIKRKRSRDIIYNTTDTTMVNKPLAVYAIPYEQYSTLTTDNVASLAGFMRMYYKDV